MAANDLGQIGKATVTVDADMSPFDKAVAGLPAKGAASAKATMDRIKREMQTNSASIASAILSQKTAGSGNEGRDQYNRAAVSIAKFREENAKLQTQMEALTATAQRKADVIAAASQKEAAAAKLLAQQNAVIAGQGAMIGNQFVAFSTRATAAAGALGNVGRMSGNAAYKIQVLGQGLDDLQYVPEMGLRPIINNLMQMSPVLGIAAIGVNVLYTNWDKITELWRDQDTIKEAKAQQELAEATAEAAKAYDEEYKAIKRAKGEVANEMRNTATAAAGKVSGQMAIDDIGDLMKKNLLYTPGIPIPEQARTLLANAKAGDIPANSRLQALVDTADAGTNRFADAYRLHDLQNQTGDDKRNQDADRRAEKTAAHMAQELAKKQQEAKLKQDGLVDEYTSHASPAARRQVLESIASGNELDKKKLSEKISENLVTSGVDAKDAGELSTKIADKLAETLDKKLRDEAMSNGTTKDKQAQAGLVDLQIEGARRVADVMQSNLNDTRKDIQQARVQSSSDFQQSLMAARPKSAEDMAKKQLDEAQKAVARLEQIRDNLARGVPARLGGP